MKKISIQFILLLFILGFFEVSVACSDLIYPDHLGRPVLDAYDIIAVVNIKKISKQDKDSMWGGAFKFEGEVIGTFKGSYRKGDIILGKTGGDRPGAACPISLSEKKSYLLFFKGKKNPVHLARYGSYYTEITSNRFKTYVKDLEVLTGQSSPKD